MISPPPCVYSGAGNTFVLIDGRTAPFCPIDAPALCSQMQTDGVLVLAPSQRADFFMHIYNADGSEAQMCGNGLRCAVHFFAHTLQQRRSHYTIETLAGLYSATLEGNRVSTHFPKPQLPPRVHTLFLDAALYTVYALNTGVPHAVVQVPDIETIPLQRWGTYIRTHPLFAPEGTNVSFFEICGRTPFLRVRTFERGVEAETLACGTGVAACTWVVSHLWDIAPPFTVETRSKDHLYLSWTPDSPTFTLEGPVRANTH